VELPGSASAAAIVESAGERFFAADFGTWENLDILDEPSLPDQKDLDFRFKTLMSDLITCLPAWSHSRNGFWDFALNGPTHTVTLAAMRDDKETWLGLRITAKAR
jgi:hypothetical protein